MSQLWQAIASRAYRSAFPSTMCRVTGRRPSRLRGMALCTAFCIALNTCQPARAEQPATLDLRSVAIPDLCRVVFKEMLHTDYILSPEVIASEQKLTLSISNQPKPKMLEILKAAFAASGFALNENAGVYFITKAQTASPNIEQLQTTPGKDATAPDGETPEMHTYKIKARPVAYLSKVAKFAGANVGELEEGGDYLIYTATEATQKRLQPLLDVLDIPQQTITIRAALIEYSETSNSGQSISFALDAIRQKLKLTYVAGAALGNSISFAGATIQSLKLGAFSLYYQLQGREPI